MSEKELNFYINSIIENLDEQGNTESREHEHLTVVGRFCKDGELTRLSYTENERGTPTKCIISVLDGKVRVVREGACRCDMLFELGRTWQTVYELPPFSFDMEIVTHEVKYSFSDDGGSLLLVYKMTIGGQDKLTKFKIRV